MQVIFDNADSLFKREWVFDQALNMMNVNFFLPEGGFDDVVYFFYPTLHHSRGTELTSINGEDMEQCVIDEKYNTVINIDNEFANDLETFVLDFGLEQLITDFGKLSSYGEIDRDGKPTVVIIDHGLNSDVFDTYYKLKRNF